MALCGVVAVVYAVTARPWTPVFDEAQYLAYARTLADTGAYAATPDGPAADPGPGREPLYPALIALVMRLDPALGLVSAECIAASDPACLSAYRSLHALNAALVALAALAVFWTVRLLGTGWPASYLGAAYVLANYQANKDISHVISDYLAEALVALVGLALVAALEHRRKPLWVASAWHWRC